MVTEIVGDELELLKQRIISNIVASGQVASGQTIASLYVEERADGGALKFHGQMPFGVLETGRKPGRVPYGFRDIIYRWMQDKGVHATPIPYKRPGLHKYSEQERGDRSLAGAIAHVIAKGSERVPYGGTKLYRDGGRKDIYSNEIPVTVANIRSKMLAVMNAEVMKSIKINR